MPTSVDEAWTRNEAPAAPPPAPPPPPASNDAHTKTSKFILLKTRSAPPGWFYQSPNPPQHVDLFEPRTGPYFFYGTLMDPKMLAEVLQLDDEPVLRPANIVGYSCRLWGQYPAVVDGEMDATVCGAAYHVQSVQDARKLAAYETHNYETRACTIHYMDGKQPDTQHGQVFMFVGNPSDLAVGTFDLSVWLKRMGR